MKTTIVRGIAAILSVAVSFLPLTASAQFTGTSGQVYFQYSVTQAGLGAVTDSIAAMNPDGSNSHIVVQGAYNMSMGGAAVSPAGAKLVYVKDDSSGSVAQYTIMLANADGTSPTSLYVAPPLTGGAFNILSNPVFSSDGSKVFFSMYNNPTGTSDGIYSIPVSGGIATQVVTSTTSASVAGTRIALTATKMYYRKSLFSGGATTYEIDSANLDGTGQVRLATIPTTNMGVSDVSIDGAKVLYTANDSAGNAQLYTVDTATGATIVKLTNQTSTGYFTGAGYSPDGTKITYNYVMSANGVDTNQGITVMNADGTAATTVRADGATPFWSTVALAAAGTYAGLPTGTTNLGGTGGSSAPAAATPNKLPKTGTMAKNLPLALFAVSLLSVLGIEVARRGRRTQR